MTKRQIRKLEVQADAFPNHVLHLLLSLITFGTWLPVWLLVSYSSLQERRRAERILERLEASSIS